MVAPCSKKIKPFIKFCGLLLFFYYFARLAGVVHQVLLDDEVHRNGIAGDSSKMGFGSEHGDIETPNQPSDIHKCKKVIHIAVICLGPDSVRDFSHMLKTVVATRKDGLHLHIVANTISRTIIQKLLVTWNLQYLSWSFIPVEKLKQEMLASNELYLQAALPFLISTNTEKVIFLTNSLRFTQDISKLWQHFDNFKDNQLFGISSSYDLSPKESSGTVAADVILMKLSKIKLHGTIDLAALVEKCSANSHIHDILAAYSMSSSLYKLPCQWSVSLHKSFNTQCLDKEQISAVVWDNSAETTKSSALIQSHKDAIISVLDTNSNQFKPPSLDCPTQPVTDIILNNYTRKQDPKGPCYEFREDAFLYRRTHMYYVRGDKCEDGGQDEFDIAILTQFTLDRFNTFEQFMVSWEGPVVAVLYANESEARQLVLKVQASAVLNQRNNIAYHVVYRRGKYYPINFLRNVALEATHTPYLIFVDVDLVPTPGIYQTLRRYIKQYMHRTDNVTLVVAAFEAFEKLPDFPKDKAAMLQLLNDKKVVGYRMNRGWNLGHKPTNYNLWETADKPYQAIWKDAYEPYMVLPSKLPLRYREELLERMGDKIAYGREIYALGYEFWVLPDVYIVHIPHPTSQGTTTWLKNKGYSRCSGRTFEEFRAELKKRFPKVKRW